MKNKKLFAMMTVILAMGLAACGGKTSSKESEKPSSAEPTPSSEVTPSSSSEAPRPSSSSVAPQSSQSTPQPSSSAPQSSQSTPQPSSSSSAPQSSSSEAPSSSSEVPPEPTKTAAVTSVDVATKSNKAYLQISGTAEGFTSADFLWALALQHAGAESAGDASTEFVLGTTATFTDADYTLPATLNNDGTFLFEYCLTDVQGIGPGLLTIHAGIKGLATNLALGQENAGAKAVDGINRYYIRGDVNNQNTIAVDALPPVALREATVFKDADSGKLYAKIGGEASGAVTQEVLDGYDTFLQFQQVGGSWGNIRRNKADGDFYWKLEGTKAYLYADIDFFPQTKNWQGTWQDNASVNYNTHLNVTTATQADCKMETAIDEHYILENSSGVKLDINVFSNPEAPSSDQAQFWGNLGFKVEKYVEPVVPEHNLQPFEHTVGEGESAVTIQKCADDDYYEVSWDAQAATDKNSFSSSGKLSGNDTGFVEYKIYSPAAMEVRLFAKMTPNTSNPYNRTTKSGDQSVWYDYKENEVGEKNILKVGENVIDQSTQTVKVGEEDVAIYELTYSDCIGSSTIEAPWVKFNVVAGINTIRITRHSGYAPNFVSFALKTILPAA